METLETKPNALETLLRNIEEGHESVLDITRATDADGKPLTTVELRRRAIQPELKPEPRLAISPPRAHTFLTAYAFTRYLEKYGSPENTVVLLDPVGKIGHGVLDELTERGREVVRLQPTYNPGFAPWAALIDAGRVEITQFCEFLMANRRVVTDPDGKTLALLLSQVRISHGITIHRGRGARAINGLVCETTIAGEKQEETVELPDSLTLETPIFLGTDTQKIEVDLTLSATRDGDVSVLVSSADLALATLKTFDAMADAIGETLAGRATVLTGQFFEGTWKTLD